VPLDAGLPPGLAEVLASRWTSCADALARTPAGLVYRLDHPLQSESATDIRRRISAGEPWRHLVPARVATAIADERLYLDRAATHGPL
jgi:nicotinate-nucleotide adenylyltransferase